MLRHFGLRILHRSSLKAYTTAAKPTSFLQPGARNTHAVPAADEKKKLQYAKVLGKAPAFKCPAVVDGKFKEVSLEDYAGKTLVLFFYPLDFTFVCPTELIAFNDRLKEFQALGAEVAAVSIDSIHSHLQWTKVPRSEGGLGPMQIPMLSDLKKTIALTYNVLEYSKGVALRGTFIIDKHGVVRHMCVNDLNIGRSVDETLRVLEAMNFADKHGEVCPANWKRGDSAIKPNPEDAKSYFKAVHASKDE